MNFYNAQWDRWFVLGVAGVGDTSAGCPTTVKPNVFARVRGYLDWIGGVTGLKPISTTPTPPTTMDPSLFDCKGKADGNYPNPASTCSITFYMCSNGAAYLFVSEFSSFVKLLTPRFSN